MVLQDFSTFDISDKTRREYILDLDHSVDPIFSYGSPLGYKSEEQKVIDFIFYHLKNYPSVYLNTMDYFRCHCYTLPFYLEKGGDSYCYTCYKDGTEKSIKRHLWFLSFEDDNTKIIPYGSGAQFKYITNGIEFALNKYKKYLEEEQNKINNLFKND